MIYLLLLVAIVTYGSFYWAFLSYFKRRGQKLKTDLLIIKYLGMSIITLHLYLISQQKEFILVCYVMGVGLLTLSLFLFWWAIRTNLKKPLSIAFTDYKPIHIVTEGPYRYIRHPLYTSYMIAWLGVPVVLGSAAAFIPGIILFYYYYKAAKLEENQFSLSEMKENYEIYRSNTGMFFPRL